MIDDLIDEPRKLEDICDGQEYKIQVYDISYCGLSFTQPVECKYCVSHKDHNGLYQCGYDLRKKIYVVK